MKLEQEIQQEKFRSEYSKLAVNIAFTHFWALDRFRRQLKPHGISLQQFNILRILRGQGDKPASINLLKERMLDKSSDASRLVERLRLKGFIDRVVCPSDRRAVEISITDKGREVLDKIDAQEKKLDDIFSQLSPEEARVLNELLDKIRG